MTNTASTILQDGQSTPMFFEKQGPHPLDWSAVRQAMAADGAYVDSAFTEYEEEPSQGTYDSEDAAALERFLQPPAPSRLDMVKNYHVFGVDLKDPSDNAPYMQVGEINGIGSGTDGIRDTDLTEEDVIAYFIQGMDVLSKDNLQDENADITGNMIREHLASYGEDKMAYIKSLIEDRLNMEVKTQLDQFAKGDLPDNLQEVAHNGWNMYDEIANTIVGVEEILSDKSTVDGYFDGMREIKPPSYDHTLEAVEQMLTEEDSAYFVVKPKDGKSGEGVHIRERDEMDPERLKEDENLIIEPFIDSKPIYSSETGDYHDGCMRYTVIVEEHIDGTMQLHHGAGYWRLSPKPMSEHGDDGAMVANYRNKHGPSAIAEKATPEELRKARETVEAFLPTVYQDMVRDVRGDSVPVDTEYEEAADTESAADTTSHDDEQSELAQSFPMTPTLN